MADRTTIKLLETLIEYLNTATGTPSKAYTFRNGKSYPNAGCYLLEQSYGYVSLNRMSTAEGGTSQSVVLPGGTRRELESQLRALLRGVEIGKECQPKS